MTANHHSKKLNQMSAKKITDTKLNVNEGTQTEQTLKKHVHVTLDPRENEFNK